MKARIDDVLMVRQVDGWMNGRMDGRIERVVEKLIVDGWMGRKSVGYKDGWLEGWTGR